MIDDDFGLCTTERIGLVARRLTLGEPLATSDVAKLTGTTRQAAWHMLCRLSRVLPLVQTRTPEGRLVWTSIDEKAI